MGLLKDVGSTKVINSVLGIRNRPAVIQEILHRNVTNAAIGIFDVHCGDIICSTESRIRRDRIEGEGNRNYYEHLSGGISQRSRPDVAHYRRPLSRLGIRLLESSRFERGYYNRRRWRVVVCETVSAIPTKEFDKRSGTRFAGNGSWTGWTCCETKAW